MLFSNCSGLEHTVFTSAVQRGNRSDFRHAQSQRARFIQNHRVNRAEFLKIKTAFDDDAAPRRATDAGQNC